MSSNPRRLHSEEGSLLDIFVIFVKVFSSKELLLTWLTDCDFAIFYLNPLTPNIKQQILLSCLHTFLTIKVLGRSHTNIKKIQHISLILMTLGVHIIKQSYFKEKFDVDHC